MIRRMLGALAFWLVVWEACYRAVGQDLLLASPGQVANYLLHGVNVRFLQCVGMSLARTAAAYVLGVAIGAALAVLAKCVPLLRALIQPMLAVIRATPVASFIILALIWFGSRNLSVFIALVMVFPVIYSNTLQGIKSADGALLEMARVYRVPFSRRLGYIYAPQVKPFLLSGCSVALGMSWKSGVAAEVIGVVGGSIGERLYEAKVYFQMTDLLAWTVVIVVCSVGFEKLVLWLLRRGFAAWEGR